MNYLLLDILLHTKFEVVFLKKEIIAVIIFFLLETYGSLRTIIFFSSEVCLTPSDPTFHASLTISAACLLGLVKVEARDLPVPLSGGFPSFLL
jgi:hypothetical protein